MKRNTENVLLADVVFEDGRMITANYVVGADGARSVVRPFLMLDVPWHSSLLNLDSYHSWYQFRRSDE